MAAPPAPYQPTDTDMSAPSSVPAMSRGGEKVCQQDALVYAAKLPEAERKFVKGCYVVKCVPCGRCPVALNYVWGGPSLCYNCTTAPFVCCALPMPFVDPYFRSIKRDATVVVVDGERGTMNCYPGEKAESPCCVCVKM